MRGALPGRRRRRPQPRSARRLGISPRRSRRFFRSTLTIYFEADLRAADAWQTNQRHLRRRSGVRSATSDWPKKNPYGFLAVNTIGDPQTNPDCRQRSGYQVGEQRLIELVRIARARRAGPSRENHRTGALAGEILDVARQYQVGRIFLVGDAAHVMRPNGGFGGNTGIHDAHDLAWKLAPRLEGVAEPALLTPTRPTRRSAIHRRAGLRPLRDPHGQLSRRHRFQPLAPDFDSNRLHLSLVRDRLRRRGRRRRGRRCRV